MSNHPILVMIGGMRCGTRALQRYVAQHPQVLSHETAHDPHFFSSDENWAKGVDHYLAGWESFDPARHRYRFESSTHYAKYPQIAQVPERMRESGLDFQFIYGVRDPLSRIESHMQHNAGKGYFDPAKPESRRKFLKSAISYSNYAMQLERFERVFPDKEIFVYAMEALQKDYLSVMTPLARFLELDPAHRFTQVKRIGTKFTASVDDARLTEAEKLEIVGQLEPAMSQFMARFGIDADLWPVWSAARAAAPVRAEQEKSAPAAPSLRRSYSGKGRFAFLTVDTEALRHRAKRDHVQRLIWGKFKKGTAGIREMASIGKEFGARHVFFVDMCESVLYGKDFDDAVRWLHKDGQDVQLHAHPELLPPEFWEERGLPAMPRRMNEYDRERSRQVLGYFKDQLVALTGGKVHAYRAGSFRWNGDTVRAMGDVGLTLSFNDTLRLQRMGRNPYSAGSPDPYRWDNGVIELPLTERKAGLKQNLAAFAFPARTEGANGLDKTYEPFVRGKDAPSCLVLLLHSWSLLHWDEERRAQYRDDKRQEDYRKLVGQMSKDYDIITTGDYLDLMSGPAAPELPTVPLSKTDAYEPEAA